MIEERVAELLSEISNMQEDSQDPQTSQKILAQIGDTQKELLEKIRANDDAITVLKGKHLMNQNFGSRPEDKEQQQINERLQQLEEENSKLKKYMSALEDKKNAIGDSYKAGEKRFDKHLLFKNIRELAAKKDVRLGQIERSAGCQPGYMSRLDKIGNTTDPSVEFVVTAAKELEVSIDLLVFSNFAKVSQTEDYILKFMEGLTNDTRDDKIHWETENADDALFIGVQKGDVSMADHPFFEYDSYEESFSYNSLFFPSDIIISVENSYCSKLPGSKAWIYVMRCRDALEDNDTEQDFFEIYIVNSGRVNPLFCSKQTTEALALVTDSLYQEIEVYMSHIHVNDEVRSIIDAYMSGDEKKSEGSKNRIVRRSSNLKDS